MLAVGAAVELAAGDGPFALAGDVEEHREVRRLADLVVLAERHADPVGPVRRGEDAAAWIGRGRRAAELPAQERLGRIGPCDQRHLGPVRERRRAGRRAGDSRRLADDASGAVTAQDHAHLERGETRDQGRGVTAERDGAWPAPGQECALQPRNVLAPAAAAVAVTTVLGR